MTKDFSLFLNVPSRLIGGEEIVLEVHVINHLERDLEVSERLAKAAVPVEELICVRACVRPCMRPCVRVCVSTGHPSAGSKPNL